MRNKSSVTVPYIMSAGGQVSDLTKSYLLAGSWYSAVILYSEIERIHEYFSTRVCPYLRSPGQDRIQRLFVVSLSPLDQSHVPSLFLERNGSSILFHLLDPDIHLVSRAADSC